MEIILNGESKKYNSETLSLIELLNLCGIENSTNGIAVAVNAELIVKGDWNYIQLQERDKVEIITARNGG